MITVELCQTNCDATAFCLFFVQNIGFSSGEQPKENDFKRLLMLLNDDLACNFRGESVGISKTLSNSIAITSLMVLFHVDSTSNIEFQI